MATEPRRLPAVQTTSAACAGSCRWWSHNYKHFARRGISREHTRRKPAVYLVVTTELEVREIEETTVRNPELIRGAVGSHRKYLRDVGRVIGWDEGKDARLSFVECSGGVTAGRAFHGRPAHDDAHVVRSMRQESPE